MVGPMCVESVLLVLTAGCNLRCSYCYQLARKPGRMTWLTLRSTLDWALEKARPDLDVVFLGGEPLLEFPLIRKAVRYISKRCPADRGIHYSISTNGMLLEENVARFLEKHRFEIQLSMDGSAKVQDLRAKGTFAPLDRLLGRLRDRNPQLFHQDLTISITLIPPAIPFLAESVLYLVEKDCRRVAIAPLITSHPAWSNSCVDQLESQLASLCDFSVDHFRRTNRIPVLLFRGEEREAESRSWRRSMCGVVRGRTPAVDVDGQVYGCALLASSFQKLEAPLLSGLHRVMRIGTIGDSHFDRKYQQYLEAAREDEILNRKEMKYSSYGRCGDCHWFDECSICPISITHIPGNKDPARVPDFACAFNRTALKYRGEFIRKARHAAETDRDLILRQFQELVRESRAQRRTSDSAGW